MTRRTFQSSNNNNNSDLREVLVEPEVEELWSDNDDETTGTNSHNDIIRRSSSRRKEDGSVALQEQSSSSSSIVRQDSESEYIEVEVVDTSRGVLSGIAEEEQQLVDDEVDEVVVYDEEEIVEDYYDEIEVDSKSNFSLDSGTEVEVITDDDDFDDCIVQQHQQRRQQSVGPSAVLSSSSASRGLSRDSERATEYLDESVFEEELEDEDEILVDDGEYVEEEILVRDDTDVEEVTVREDDLLLTDGRVFANSCQLREVPPHHQHQRGRNSMNSAYEMYPEDDSGGDNDGSDDPDDEDEDEDDGVSADELTEAIVYVLRQEKAVAKFILTEEQADKMAHLPLKVMKVIVDHLESCDNDGTPIDWDFMLKIVLPFCDSEDQGAGEDEDGDEENVNKAGTINPNKDRSLLCVEIAENS